MPLLETVGQPSPLRLCSGMGLLATDDAAKGSIGQALRRWIDEMAVYGEPPFRSPDVWSEFFSS